MSWGSYVIREVQEEYKRRNDGQENLVRANDVFFALHALILSTFTLAQTWVYKRDHSQRVSLPARAYISVSIIVTFGLVIQALRGQNKEWIDILYFLSYIKLIISFVKYCPQVYINWAAKSTAGWSIHNILLDFTGGVLSISQLVLDAYISGDWSGISGDPVKFGLGFLSIAFDLVFITQHYILYRDRTDYYVSSVKDGSNSEDSSNSNNNGNGAEDERQGLLAKGDAKKYNAQEESSGDLESGSNSIEEARKNRQEEWKKAYENKENPPPLQEEETYDPRTLFERLQEQKQKKADAFAEATKFGNLIHKIDNDEFDFLRNLEDEEAEKKRQRDEQEQEELKKFRMNVQIKSAPPPPQPAAFATSTFASSSSSSSPPTAIAAKKRKPLFAGLVKRRDDDNKGSSSLPSKSPSPTPLPSAKESSAVGSKRKNESHSPLDSVGSDEAENKKPKVETTTPAAKPKSNALLSLAAYDSCSDEDD
ncbi:hypothetical protein BGZ49_006475 [Haplosporangium sp. Z 27]|nr:hypothetical protein BGZ49_006475 [Haplosporangium sp. Z 27]